MSVAVWLHDKLAIRRQVSLGEYTRLSYGRKANDVGELEIALPFGSVRPQVFTEDSVIVVEENGTLAFDTIWLVDNITIDQQNIVIKAKDAMAFLARRWILFPEGDPGAQKFQALDDMVKAVVRENVTNATDINRNLVGISTAANVGRAPADQLAFDGENVLKTLQTIAQDSVGLGTYLTFDIVMTTPTTGIFTTWTGQRGLDRRSGFGTRRFGPDRGNIINSQIEIDYTDRASKVTAFGAGEGAVQRKQTDQDPTPLYETRWGVIETVHQATNIDDDALLLATARSERAHRGTKIRFRGELQDTVMTRYGRDYNYGDILPVEAYGYAFACRVVSVVTTIEGGKISRSCQLEAI